MKMSSHFTVPFLKAHGLANCDLFKKECQIDVSWGDVKEVTNRFASNLIELQMRSSNYPWGGTDMIQLMGSQFRKNT
jgi:hypothetical protein